MGTSLRSLMPLSLLQRDELGGPKLADSPLPSEPPAPRHKGSLAGASPTAMPALIPLAPKRTPCKDTGVAPVRSERAQGAACSGLERSGFGHPGCPPNPLCCCPIAVPIPRSW